MARVRDTSSSVEIKSHRVSQFVSQTRKKAAKGTVVVQVFKDRLRLCWSFLGKRYFLYIGLPDSKVNRTVSESKARVIEGDMATGNFDPTLKKYKPEFQQKLARISVVKLFETFMLEKAKEVTLKTMEKYQATLRYLSRPSRLSALVSFGGLW